MIRYNYVYSSIPRPSVGLYWGPGNETGMPDSLQLHETVVPISQSTQCGWWELVLAKICPVQCVTLKTLCNIYTSFFQEDMIIHVYQCGVMWCHVMSCDVMWWPTFCVLVTSLITIAFKIGYSCPPPPMKPLDLFPGPTQIFTACSSHGGERA